MPGFGKSKDPVANKLRMEAEPNTLSWPSADTGVWGIETTADDHSPEADLTVEPEGDQAVEEQGLAKRRADLQAELEREADQFGLTTDDPKRTFGPAGDEIAAILSALANLNDEKAVALTDKYNAVPEAEFQDAHSAVLDRFRGSGCESELWAAEHAISDWLASLKLVGEEEVFSTVADVATDAVDALILEDLLSDEEFETLYGPWSRVMETDTPAAGVESVPVAEAAREPDAEVEGEPLGDSDGVFGPNSDLVVQFLERLETLRPPDIAVLVTAWGKQPKEALRVAHADLKDIAEENPEWREQIHRAQAEVANWTVGSARGLKDIGDASVVSGPVRQPAGPAAADAVAALVMADVLEREDSETLYAPWAEVVGWPALPTYEDEDEGGGDATD